MLKLFQVHYQRSSTHFQLYEPAKYKPDQDLKLIVSLAIIKFRDHEYTRPQRPHAPTCHWMSQRLPEQLYPSAQTTRQ